MKPRKECSVWTSIGAVICVIACIFSASGYYIDVWKNAYLFGHLSVSTTSSRRLVYKFNGGTCFSKIDAADAYLQMEVDGESKNLLTANTHRVYITLTVFRFS